MATTYTWVGGDGSTPTAWTDPKNWSPNTGTPQNSDSVIIPGGSTITAIPPGAQIASLSFTNLGTSGTPNVVSLSGGQSGTSVNFYGGIQPPTGINLVLTGYFKSGDAIGGGGGTIILNDATVKATSADATGTFMFQGTGNALYVPDGSTGLVLKNVGPGDQLSFYSGGNVNNPSDGPNAYLTLNPDGKTYTLKVGSTYPGSELVSSSVTFATGVTPTVTESNGLISFCFLAGTRLATPHGKIAVEDITAGTMLLTASGETKPVRWLGRSVVATKFADPLTKLPIRIKAGALGDNLPIRDLLVSPCHAIFIGGILVHAGALVNGTSITQETDMPEMFFTYYHVELATHELLLAEGAPAESFIDNVDRMAFQNWAEHEAIAGADPIEEMSYPRAKSYRQIPLHIRRMLGERATPFEPAKAA